MARKQLINIKLRGFQQSANAIEMLARRTGEHMVSGMRVIGEQINTDVKASRPGAGVPRDTGVLASTGRVTGPDTKGKGRGVVEITYGGAAAQYALRQHETLEYRHRLGEARYLIRGLERWVGQGGVDKALRANAEAGIRAAHGRGFPPRDDKGRFIRYRNV